MDRVDAFIHSVSEGPFILNSSLLSILNEMYVNVMLCIRPRTCLGEGELAHRFRVKVEKKFDVKRNIKLNKYKIIFAKLSAKICCYSHSPA